MKAVIQRVQSASVTVDGEKTGSIDQGMLVFLGVAKEDTQEDLMYLVRKIVELRMFDDKDGKMNLSVNDVQGGMLVVSQFTLLGSCAKGRRPSFDAAADPAKAEDMYNCFVETLRTFVARVETGRFRAMMNVSLINDGPVTFILDSKERS